MDSVSAAPIAWLREHASQWDLAVVDMFLSEGSGLGVLRECRARRPDQLVVVLTNYATDEMRRRCLAAGADTVFDKSTELEAFLTCCLDASHRVSALAPARTTDDKLEARDLAQR